MRVKAIAKGTLCGLLAVLGCATSGDRLDDSGSVASEGDARGSSGSTAGTSSDAHRSSEDAFSSDGDGDVASSIRDVQSDFSTTCGVCEAGQTCAPGYGGTYCVTPCPGQPCPDSGPQVPYCDAYGGVHCLSQ